MLRIIAAILLPTSLWAGSVLPLNLSDLTHTAGKIFAARCVGNQAELDENNIPSRLLRLEVTRPLRGVRQGDLLWVKQIEGSTGCRAGGEYLYFLYPESALGFTSPVGLGQGRFHIERGADGVSRVRSPFPHLAREIGDRDLEALLRLIRSLEAR